MPFIKVSTNIYGVVMSNNNLNNSFAALEQMLCVPIHANKNFQANHNTREIAYLRGEQFGILIDVPVESSIIKKISAFFSAIIKVYLTQKKISQQPLKIINIFAVYPSISEPLITYALGTHAENYANRNILPYIPSSLNGFIRKLIMKIGKCHPSVAGFIILVEV